MKKSNHKTYPDVETNYLCGYKYSPPIKYTMENLKRKIHDAFFMTSDSHQGGSGGCGLILTLLILFIINIILFLLLHCCH
jgi:hypothetical protein